MTDILEEPPLEGQKGYKGPGFLAGLFQSRVKRDTETETEDQVDS